MPIAAARHPRDALPRVVLRTFGAVLSGIWVEHTMRTGQPIKELIAQAHGREVGLRLPAEAAAMAVATRWARG